MDYEQMLDRAYSLLPAKATKTDRFEIPVADVFVQGHQTVLRNFDFIAQALRRPPEMLAKYLFKELATPGDIQGNRLILNRKLNDRVLNERINAFTKTYVLCKECGKPDTSISDLERGVKMLSCEACGARHPVKSV